MVKRRGARESDREREGSKEQLEEDGQREVGRELDIYI